MTVLSHQVLALPSDTANDGQTRLSVPKHSQTSQEARKTRFDWSQVSSWGLAAEGEALTIVNKKPATWDVGQTTSDVIGPLRMQAAFENKS